MGRLLLIDKRVTNYQAFIDSARGDVYTLTYSYDTDTYESILSRIPSGISYESAGIVSHRYDSPLYQFIETATSSNLYSVEQTDPDLESWKDYMEFLRLLNVPVIDMMACRLFADPDWKYVFETVEKKLGIQIRASTDDTGNLSAGGNWVMESDNVNVENIYFTSKIEEYTYLLYDTIYWKSNRINTSNILYGNQNVNRTILAWGDLTYGADISGVIQDVSSGVVAVYSTNRAFAALRSNGSVIAWGNPTYGGNSTAVRQDISSGVIGIYSTDSAFAALKSNGSVIVWGDSARGGSVTTPVNVAAQLTSGVQAIYSTASAFAALKSNGSVVTWGNTTYGGNPSATIRQDISSGIVAIYSNDYAFAAVNGIGKVTAWGDNTWGGNPSATVRQDISSGVINIFNTSNAFAALKSNRSLITWGSANGGTSTSVSGELLADISNVYSTDTAFAALKTTGKAVVWGSLTNGGDASGVIQDISSGVVSISSTPSAFAALKSNGSVITWGNPSYGGSKTSPVNSASQLTSGVSRIYSNTYGFAAIKSNGSVVSWGDNAWGGNSSTVSSLLSSGVIDIYNTITAFGALKSDGSVVTWGNSTEGGNSSALSAELSYGVSALYATRNAFVAIKPIYESLPSTGSVRLGKYLNSIKSRITTTDLQNSVQQYVVSNRSRLTTLIDDVSGSIVTNFIKQKVAGYDETSKTKLTIITNNQTIDLSQNRTELISNTKELYMYGISGDIFTLKFDNTSYTIRLRDDGAVYNNTLYTINQSVPLGPYIYNIKALGSIIGQIDYDASGEGSASINANNDYVNPYPIGTYANISYYNGYYTTLNNAYNDGYVRGRANLPKNNTYSAQKLRDAYDAGYSLGYSQYATTLQILEPTWARRIGDNISSFLTAYANNISTDSQNNIYVVGTYTDLLKVYTNDNLTSIIDVSNVGSRDVFIVKYNSSGLPLWARHIAGSSNEYGLSIVTDSLDNIYITGVYFSTILTAYASASNDTINKIDISNVSSNDAFVVKYDSSGTPLWGRHISGTSSDYGFSVATDGLNNIYITGTYGSNPLTVYASASNDIANKIDLSNTSTFSDTFIVKYDSSGAPQWARHLGGTSNDYGYSITTDNLYNVYVTGFYTNEGTVYASASNNLTNKIDLSSSGLIDTFIVKYDSSGTLQWARHIGGAGTDNGYGIITDSFNNVYVSGLYGSSSATVYASPTNDTANSINLFNAGPYDVFIVKYDSSGSPLWGRHISGSSGDEGYGITIDSFNNIYITGYYTNSAIVYASASSDITGKIDLPNTPTDGDNDAFIVKYDSSGTPLFAKSIGGIGNERGFGITCDLSNNIYLCGTYSANPLNIYTSEFTAQLPKGTPFTSMYLVKYNTTTVDYTGFIDVLPPTGLVSLSSYFNTIKSYAVSSTVRETTKRYVKANTARFTSLVDDVSGSILTNFIVGKSAGYDETAKMKLTIVTDGQTVDLSSNKIALASNTKELYLYGLSGDQVILKLDNQNYLLTILDNGVIYSGTTYGLGQIISLGLYTYSIKATGSVIGQIDYDASGEAYTVGVANLPNLNPYTLGSYAYTSYNAGYNTGQVDRGAAYDAGYTDGIYNNAYVNTRDPPLYGYYDASFNAGVALRISTYNVGYNDGIYNTYLNNRDPPLREYYDASFNAGASLRNAAYNAGYNDGIYNNTYVNNRDPPFYQYYDVSFNAGQAARLTAYNTGYDDGTNNRPNTNPYGPTTPLYDLYEEGYAAANYAEQIAYNAGVYDAKNGQPYKPDYSDDPNLQAEYDDGYYSTLADISNSIYILPRRGRTTLQAYFQAVNSAVETSYIRGLIKPYLREYYYKFTSLVDDISGSALTNQAADISAGYTIVDKSYIMIMATDQYINFTLTGILKKLIFENKELYIYGLSGETVNITIEGGNYTLRVRDDGLSYKGVTYGVGSTLELGSYTFRLGLVGSAGGPLTYDVRNNGGYYNRNKNVQSSERLNYLECKTIFAGREYDLNAVTRGDKIDPKIDDESTKIKKNKGAVFTTNLEAIAYEP